MATRRTQQEDAPQSADLRAERIEALSLAESASARIVDLIHSGRLHPGQRLPSERSLAADLQVSRPIVREALRTLESAGLIETRAGSGRYVSRSDSGDGSPPLTNWMKLQPIGDIVAVRRVLEPEAIRAIPATRVAETAAAARGAFEQMKRAHRRGAYETAAEFHTRFHRVLVQYASTRLLRNLLASMIEAASLAQLEVFRTPRAGAHSLHKHLKIVEALEMGDVALTADRVAEHLEPAFTYPAERRGL